MSSLRRPVLKTTNPAASPVVVDEVAEAILEGGERLRQLEQLQQPGAVKFQGTSDAVVGKGVGAHVHGLELTPQERTAAQMGALQLLQLKEPIPGGATGRIFLERAMADLSHDGYSPAAQRRFVEELRARLKLASTEHDGAHLTREQRRDLAWVASTLRQAVDFSRDRPEARLDDVAEFYDEQGLRLRWFDKYDFRVHHGSLDRVAFKNELHSIVEDAKEHHGGVLTEHHLGLMLSRLAKVTDLDDMKWARHRLDRYLMLEEVTIPERLVIPGRDGRPDKVVNLREKFDKFMAKNLLSNSDVAQVSLGAYLLRQAIESAHDPTAPSDTRDARLAALERARNRFAAVIDAAAADKQDPDALFAARRRLCKELGGKCGLPEAHSLRDELLKKIDAKLAVGDRLDRYTRKREIETLRKGGVITDSEAAVMRIAVASSVTETEFRATTTYFDQTLKLHVFAMIAKIMDEVSEILTHAEKERRRLERLLLEQRYQAQVFESVRSGRAFVEKMFLEGGIKLEGQQRIVLNDSIADRLFAKAGVHTPADQRIQLRTTTQVKQEQRVVTKSAQVREQGARTAQTGVRAMLPAAAKTTKPADTARYGSLLGLIAQFEAEAVRNMRQQLPS